MAALGVNTVCLGDSANHKEYSLEKFGSEEAYYKKISALISLFITNVVYYRIQRSRLFHLLANGISIPTV